MENINLIIGNNIKELRKSNKLTQYELAEKLNYSNKAISRWESGDIIPDVLTLNKICEVFNIPLSQIFEKNVTQTKVKKHYRLQIGNKLAISLLSILLVWLVATIVFVYSQIILNTTPWQVFIMAIPASCIVGLVFNCIWGKRGYNFLIISAMVWSLLACIYIWLQNYNIWPIFLIGIPVQIGIILWSNITKE